MKNILFVIQSLGIGGAERAQVTLANRLVKAGYDVTILMWLPRFDFQTELDERVHVIYKAPDRHIGNRIPYIRHKFYDDSMWAVRATPRQFYRYYVGHKKYDVEIAFFHSWAVKIVSGCTRRGSLRIAWIHNDFRGLSEKDHHSYLLQEGEYARMDKVVCVSEEARKGYIQTFGDKGNITTIYNLLPIDEIRRKAEQKPEIAVRRGKFHLVLVGRHADHTKGQIRLIETVEKLRGEGCDISLSLVGRGEHTELFRETVREKGMQDCVFVIDGKTNPYPYVKEADLSVCASYTEGYNLTVAEAMILGKPVLSTDCAGPVEILDGGKYGMLVENSAEGLYTGIKKLYHNPGLVEHYRAKAVERCAFFDEDRIMKQITALWGD